MFCKVCGTNLDDASQYCNVCGTVVNSSETVVLSNNTFEPSREQKESNQSQVSETTLLGTSQVCNIYETYTKKKQVDSRESVNVSNDIISYSKDNCDALMIGSEEENFLKKKQQYLKERKEYRDAKEKRRIEKKRKRLIISIGASTLIIVCILIVVLNFFAEKVDYNAINEQIYNCDVGLTNTFYYKKSVCYYDLDSQSIITYNSETMESEQIPIDESYDVVRVGRLSYLKGNFYLSLLVKEDDSYAVKILKINEKKMNSKELVSNSIFDMEHVDETSLVFYMGKNCIYSFEEDASAYIVNKVSFSGKSRSISKVNGAIIPNMVDEKIYFVSDNRKGFSYVDINQGDKKVDVSKGLTVDSNGENEIIGNIVRIYALDGMYYVIDDDNRLYVIYEEKNEYGKEETIQIVKEVAYTDEVIEGANVTLDKKMLNEGETDVEDLMGNLHGIPELFTDGSMAYLRLVLIVDNLEYYNGLVEIDSIEKALGGESIFDGGLVKRINETIDIGLMIDNGHIEYYTGNGIIEKAISDYQQPYGISQVRTLYETSFEDYYQELITEEEYKEKLNENMIYDPIGYVYYISLTNEETLNALQECLNTGDYIGGYNLAVSMLPTIANGTDKYYTISDIQEKCYESGKTAYISELKDLYRANDSDGYNKLKSNLYAIYGSDQEAIEEINNSIRKFSNTSLLSYVSYHGTNYNISYDRTTGTVDGCTIVMDYAHPEMQFALNRSYLYFSAPVFTGNVLPIEINSMTENGVGYWFDVQDGRIVAYHQNNVPNLSYVDDINWIGLDLLYEYDEQNRIVSIYSSNNDNYRYTYEYDDSNHVVRETAPTLIKDEEGNIIQGENITRTFTYNENGYLSGWTEGTGEGANKAEIYYTSDGKMSSATIIQNGEGEVINYTFGYNDKGLCSEVKEEYADGAVFDSIFEYQTVPINPNITAELGQ